MTNLRVGVRLALGFGLVLVLVGLVATVGYVRMASLHAGSVVIGEDRLPKRGRWSAPADAFRWRGVCFARAKANRISHLIHSLHE